MQTATISFTLTRNHEHFYQIEQCDQIPAKFVDHPKNFEGACRIKKGKEGERSKQE